jgi:hypothetical protein
MLFIFSERLLILNIVLYCLTFKLIFKVKSTLFLGTPYAVQSNKLLRLHQHVSQWSTSVLSAVCQSEKTDYNILIEIKSNVKNN